MELIKGSYLEKLPLEPLRIIADLVYYDGPLLTLLSSQSGENDYFYYWCDIDDRYNRWLVFRVTETQIKSYLQGQRSLREVIRHPMDNYYFVGDMDNQLNWQQVWLVMLSDLPSSYLPKEDSWFDKELDGINEEDWKILEQRFLTDSSYFDERISKTKRGQRLSGVAQTELTNGISKETLEQVLTEVIGKQLETLLPKLLEEKTLAKPSTASLIAN